MGIIYGIHKGDGEIRYVGQTRTSLEKRRYEHYRHAKKATAPVHFFLLKYGDGLVFEVLEEVPVERLNEAEVRWIAELRAQGADLLNCTDGGLAGTTVSAETRAKMSANTRGWQTGSEELARMQEAQLRWVRSPEGRARMSEAKSGPNHHFYGKTWTDEYRSKVMAGRMKTYAITEQDVRDIRRRRAEGEQQKALAVEYGISPSAISKIVSRQRWAWVA